MRHCLAMLYSHQDEIPVSKKITGQDGPPFSTPPLENEGNVKKVMKNQSGRQRKTSTSLPLEGHKR